MIAQERNSEMLQFCLKQILFEWAGPGAKMSHFSGKCHWLKIVSPAEFKAPHKKMISLFG